MVVGRGSLPSWTTKQMGSRGSNDLGSDTLGSDPSLEPSMSLTLGSYPVSLKLFYCLKKGGGRVLRRG